MTTALCIRISEGRGRYLPTVAGAGYALGRLRVHKHTPGLQWGSVAYPRIPRVPYRGPSRHPCGSSPTQGGPAQGLWGGWALAPRVLPSHSRGRLVARICVAVPSAPLACVAARLTHPAPDTSCVSVGWGRRPCSPARGSAGPAGGDLPSTYIRSASAAPVLQYVAVTVTARTSDTVCQRAGSIFPPLAPVGPRRVHVCARCGWGPRAIKPLGAPALPCSPV